jgi:ornithine cyclodeaminase/alanine dehydrogenase-like protein (mu-crystallin family)
MFTFPHMSFVVLGAKEVERLLPMRECIDVMARAFVDLERGALVQPLRAFYVPPGVRGGTMWMPAYRSSPTPMFGTKLLFVLQDNPSRGLDSHQGQVILADGETGQLRALLDASAVTAIRTAAVSALATRLLAREDARVLAIIGTGVQARKHLESIPLVRPITHVLVAGRTPEHARQFVFETAKGAAIPVEAAESIEAAVRVADIVVTVTSSPTPVIERGWLRAGAHVNAVGASRPIHREIDTRTVADALLFTDRRESLEAEAGDYREAIMDGALEGADVAGELGELLTGTLEGRTSDGQLTLFRSLGLAVEDLAAAEHVLAKALENGAGITVDPS